MEVRDATSAKRTDGHKSNLNRVIFPQSELKGQSPRPRGVSQVPSAPQPHRKERGSWAYRHRRTSFRCAARRALASDPSRVLPIRRGAITLRL